MSCDAMDCSVRMTGTWRYLLRDPIVRVAVVLFLLVSACRGSDGPTDPELDQAGLPRFDVVQLDCQFSAQRCAIIQAGIDAMKAHANSECRVMGGLAQGRYDAASGMGFREQPQYKDKSMGVNVNLSTGAPLDGYTNVYPVFWSNPFISQDVATGALIAHEEAHHQGSSEAQAEAVQNRCLNPQP